MEAKPYFEKFQYYSQKGKGVSVYCSTKSDLIEFQNRAKESKVIHQTVLLSEFNKEELHKDTQLLIVFQDLDLKPFFLKIGSILNRLVFPAFYRNIPIAYFCSKDKSAFDVQIESSKIHYEFESVVNSLYLEQLDSILALMNFQYPSPTFRMPNLENVHYTPIEKILRDRLIEEHISFTPQVRFGKYFVDFVVEISGKKLIVECDGKDFHNPHRDFERDKEIQKAGHPIIRLTGSAIFRNVTACTDRIRNTITSQQKNSRVTSIDEKLDDSQIKAVKSISGPIRVLAPAGSGKTTTIVNRIIHLINNGIPEDEIFALAFNKKASEEMKSRLNSKSIPVADKIEDQGVTIRTFHSFGLEIVRKYLNWNFDGLNEAQNTRRLITESFEPFINIPRYKYKDAIDRLLEELRRVKLELPPISGEEVEIEGNKVDFEPIFNLFLQKQRQCNFFNYDDMIYLALRILLDNKVARKTIQTKFKYILVDEFQDLNEAQLLLMQILALPYNNLYIVGDDDQMIYGWLGAKVKHIIDFPKRFSESKDFTLETNYRCTKKVVRHSGWLIDNNKNRVPKNIKPKNDAKEGLLEIQLDENLYKQAIITVDWIIKEKEQSKSTWSDFAVLFRYHEYQFAVAMVLDAKKIPHSPVNSRRLFTKGPGKDIYSYLSIILHPTTALQSDFERILKRPNKYITNQIISTVKDWDSLLKLKNLQIEDWRQQPITDFIDQMEDLKENWPINFKTPLSLVNALSDYFNLLQFYKDEANLNNDIDESSDEIIFEIILSVAANFKTVLEFYNHIYQSVNDQTTIEQEEQPKNQVILSSVHTSKGKEYKNVIFFNLARISRSNASDLDIEEERRICYVGLTRSIQNLFITAPLTGFSPFLKEILLNPQYLRLQTQMINNTINEKKKNEQQVLAKIRELQVTIKSIYTNYPEIEGGEYIIDTSLQIVSQEKEINYLQKKYPEILGKEIESPFPIFKDYFIRKRLERIKLTTKRIEELRSQIQAITERMHQERKNDVIAKTNEIEILNNRINSLKINDLNSIREEFAALNLEITYRNLLNQ